MNGRLLAFTVLALLSCSEPPAPPPRVPDPDLRHQTEQAVVDAIHAARDAVNASPQDGAVWGAYADLLGVYGYEVDAARCYAVAADLQPREFRWPYLRGLTLVMRDPPTAYAALERALEIDPDYAVGQVKAGNLAIDLDRTAEARAHFDKALALDPDCVEGLLGLGRWWLSQEDPAKARPLLEKALSLDERHPDVHEALSRALFQLGATDLAAEHAARARQLARKVVLDDPRGKPQIAPVSSLDFLKYGLALIAEGKPKEAREKFQIAVERNPDLTEARFNLALNFAVAGELPEARAQFEELLRRRPDHVDSLLRLGAIDAQEGRVAEAKQCFDRVLELDPENVPVNDQLGQLHERTARKAGAIQYYARAVELAPDLLDVRRRLANLLLEVGRPADAAAQWEEICARSPERAETLAAWGRALATAEQHDRALEVLRRAEALAPTDAELGRTRMAVQRAAAAAAMTAGDEARAHELLTTLCKERPDWAPGLRTYAWLLATARDDTLRDPARALELARSAVEHMGERADAAALDTLAVALAANGRFEEAAAQSRLALERAPKDSEQASRIAARLALFEAGEAYRGETEPPSDGR